MAGELAGLRAIVTGGFAGEGLSAAEGLLRAGATVSLWDDDTRGMERARAELEGQELRADAARDVTGKVLSASEFNRSLAP